MFTFQRRLTKEGLELLYWSKTLNHAHRVSEPGKKTGLNANRIHLSKPVSKQFNMTSVYLYIQFTNCLLTQRALPLWSSLPLARCLK